VTVRIRWKTPSGEGAFPLGEQPLHLVWIEGRLDRVGVPPARGDGLRISPPDAESRIRLEAFGEIRFLARGRSFRKVTLPLGRGLPFRLGDRQGSLLAEKEETQPGDPLVGRVLGGNRLLERLGRGAVGAVYRALQLNLEREVALKILDPRLAQDAGMVASFRREARAAGQLVHPNIVQVYDVGQAEGFPFYSMELVAGGSLEDRLRREGPLDWKEAVKAVRDCAQALTYAEEHDLVHRDVKPANLMIHPSGHVKLADLGLAATRGLIDQEAAGGTPHFMAPEAIGGRPVDTRADLYSLGCTLFRLVTGSTPFSGATVREILLAHRDAPLPSFRKAGFPVPRELEDLLAAMLAKDPEERPASASQVVETCETILHARRSRRMIPLLGIVLAAAAGGFLWWSNRKPPGGEEVRVEYRQDPEVVARSQEMARRLAEQKIQLRLAEALALPDAGARRQALDAFLKEFPEGPLAAKAQAERTRLDAQVSAEAAPPPEATAADLARKALEAGLDRLIQEQHFGAALQLLAASPPADAALRESLHAKILSAAEEALAGWESEHARLLQESDWQAAGDLRARFAAALAGMDPLPDGWRERETALVESAHKAETAFREEAFRAARAELLQSFRSDVLPALFQLRFQSAGDAYRKAVDGCSHPALRAAGEAETGLFSRASAAVEALRKRLDSGEEFWLIEPREGKRALLLGLEPRGPHVQVQVHGKRTERSDDWAPYLRPDVLPRILLDAGSRESDVAALALLLGQARLAGALRSWGTQPPTSSEAAARAREARGWLEAARPEGSPEEGAEAASGLQGLQHFADLADALAAGDSYLAFQRLGFLRNHFSLLSAWASDGSSSWGLEP